MALVEAHPVTAEPVELVPCREVLGTGPHGNLRFEMGLGKQTWQAIGGAQVIQRLAIGQQVEDKDLHAHPRRVVPPRYCPS